MACSAGASTHDLLLACKEALRNVGQHAHATRVLLRCAWTPKMLRIEIEDNGVGFPLDSAGAKPPHNHWKHTEMTNMQHRLEKHGGRFDRRDGQASGTVVTLEMPY